VNIIRTCIYIYIYKEDISLQAHLPPNAIYRFFTQTPPTINNVTIFTIISRKKIQHASITSSKPSNNNPNKTFFRQTEFIREWATAIILSSLVGKKKTAAAEEFHLFRRLLLHARKPYRPTSNLAHWKRNAHARAPTASPSVHART